MAREEPVDDGAVTVPSRVVAVAIVGVELLVAGADPVCLRSWRLRRGRIDWPRMKDNEYCHCPATASQGTPSGLSVPLLFKIREHRLASSIE